MDKSDTSYYERGVNWWNSYVTYENQKKKKIDLTPYKLFPLTKPAEKGWFYNIDDKGQDVP